MKLFIHETEDVVEGEREFCQAFVNVAREIKRAGGIDEYIESLPDVEKEGDDGK